MPLGGGGSGMPEETTVHIRVDDTTDELVLPRGVIRFFAGGEQSPAETVGDLLAVGCTQRLHGFVHHRDDDPGPRVRDLEGAMRDRFEQRFGMPFEDILDHEH